MASTLLAGCTGNADGPESTLPPSQAPSAPAPSATGVAPTTEPSTAPSATAGTPDQGDGGQASALDATAVITIAAVSTLDGSAIFGGYVAGVIENGGSCVFTVSNAAVTPTTVATSTGAANSDSTSCGSPSVPAGVIASGTYSVTLTYSNSQGSTTSDPVTMEVP